ncbi:MAG TPA: hypothetical protein VEG34_12935, partial [Thermoanaerobaculia bacterium]|nr:hypothetical protein [Thermoanaerobaculia bacterium]
MPEEVEEPAISGAAGTVGAIGGLTAVGAGAVSPRRPGMGGAGRLRFGGLAGCPTAEAMAAISTRLG